MVRTRGRFFEGWYWLNSYVASYVQATKIENECIGIHFCFTSLAEYHQYYLLVSYSWLLTTCLLPD